VAERERELTHEQASGFEELDSERQALEELLDEALADLQAKDDEIGRLETSLRRASKDAAAAESARTREADQLSRRLRTLYKNLEVDDRALSDLVALRDDSMKLRAEEVFKKLSDDVETAGARRKVGGLPPGMPVFEIGFAGKGRIYYTRGGQRRIRILCVGAKNSQKKDLEYLSRIVTQSGDRRRSGSGAPASARRRPTAWGAARGCRARPPVRAGSPRASR
jgi:putative component of toxin-antitoxin plasmid stabilization module